METDDGLPIISTGTAALLSTLFILTYVLPFYLSPLTRPSPILNRDAPAVIHARIRSVCTSCLISTLSTMTLIRYHSSPSTTLLDTLHLLGYYPFLHPLTTSILNPLALTTLLFLGPLFEKAMTTPSWRDRLSGPNSALTILSSTVGVRNYIAGPVTEEILFRSVLVPLHLLAGVPAPQIVFLTPLYFGIAHVHHFYDFTLTHPNTPTLPALLRSVFQFTYTTLFGWYATFVYLRTASLPAVVLIHSFCNWCGLPRLWGSLEIESDERDRPSANVALATITYYILLFAGLFSFIACFWTLTESSAALGLVN